MSRKHVTFDIETTGLTPDTSRVVAIAVAKQVGNQTDIKVVTTEKQNEHSVVESFLDTLSDLENGSVVATYNGDTFDWPFLISRAMKFDDYGDSVDELFRYKERHGFDLFKSHGYSPETGYRKLEDLLKEHGIEHTVGCDGGMIPKLVSEGKWHTIERYAREDALKTHKLVKKLHLDDLNL